MSRCLFGLALMLLLPAAGSVSADQLTDLLGADNATPIATDKVIAASSSKDADRKIKRRLQEIFAELDAFRQVEIDVNKGVITLRGEVDSSATQEQALRFARQIEGVVAVKDDLVINRDLATRLDTTRRKLEDLGRGIVSGLPLFLLALAVVTLFWFIGARLGRRTDMFSRIAPNQFIAELLGLILKLSFIVLGIVLALVLLDATALIGTILGAAGLVGLAIGFAVRDTVENFIASILLSLRNPFAINDFVDIDGHQGNVLRLTSRATVLISSDGNHIRIPNATVFKAVIVNYTRNPERRFEFDVGVDTDHDLLAAQALALETLKKTQGVLSDPKPLVVINQLGDSNVVLRNYGWVNQKEASFIKVRSEAIRAVKTAFDEAGIVMPEPIYRVRLTQTGETQAAAQVPSASATPKVYQDKVDTRDVQDVSPDRAVEERVEEEQAQDKGQNLLSDKADKEL